MMGTPDIQSDDDDGDGILDSVDDDDDNDGVMDWNEKDGNPGGKGNEYNESEDNEGFGATGKGRGDGPGDSGPKKGESDFQEKGPDDPENPVNGGTKDGGDG